MNSFITDKKHMFSKMLYSIIPLWWCHDVVCFSIYTQMGILYNGFIWWWNHKVAMCLIHIYMYIMILWWWDVIRIRWWLRSITGPYGRPAMKIAYGETLIHSTEAIWEILAREEWLGCQHDISSMVDISGSLLVWAQYMIFFDL